MRDQEVPLPLRVERMIEKICLEQFQPPPDPDARKILASIGEDNSMHMLNIISQTKIRTFSGFIKYMLKDYKPKPTVSNALLSPQHPYASSPSGMDGSIIHSPFPKYLLRSPSRSDKTDTPTTRGGSPSTIGQKRAISVPGQLLASPSGNSRSPTRKKLKFSYPLSTIPENTHIDTNRESTFIISKQWQILSELQFRKSFLILGYIGRKKLENVVSEEDAYNILKMKDYPMERFELEIWTMYGRFSFVGSESTERRKYLDWECGKTYHYHCHVWRDGSLSFKGPYLKSTKTLLHRTFGDENILIVKFEDQARNDSTICSGDYNALYGRVAKKGILVGQRSYRFFVFKDGYRKGKKKSPMTSDTKCYFIRMEFIAPCDVRDPYNLSRKTVHEARCLFMHLHTTPSMAKYASRCSLILSQTIKVEVNLDTVYIERIEDIPCQDDNGISVCNEDGDLLIHTDGTGFISEDLAMKCPRAFLSARYRKAKNSEVRI